MPDIRKTAHLTALLLAVLALGAAAFFYSNALDVVPGIPADHAAEPAPSEDGVPTPEPDSASACAEAGGIWNPCASACPDAGPDEFCIEVCVERCEALGTEGEVSVYFHNPMLSSREEPHCDEVYPARRDLTRVVEEIPWSQVALLSLLGGTTEAEEEVGFSTSLPDGVALLDFDVEKRVARVDFSAELDEVAGSCRVEAVRAQIERTLTQFPDIDEVVISVDGKDPAEALQP
jgi:hypothetical protein